MQNKYYSIFIMSMLIASLQFINANKNFNAKKLLELHNRYRALHGSNALKLDSKISALAMEAALNEANNIPYEIKDYGKNIYRIDNTDEITAEIVFDFWCNEGTNYNYFEEPSNMEPIKNFTQILWGETIKIGIAIATVYNKSVVVALYFPKGNIPTRYRHNINIPNNFFS